VIPNELLRAHGTIEKALARADHGRHERPHDTRDLGETGDERQPLDSAATPKRGLLAGTEATT
jgi:hypothetical protein